LISAIKARLSNICRVFICDGNQSIQNYMHLFIQRWVTRQFFGRVNKENGQTITFFCDFLNDLLFLKAVGFPRQSFDTIAIDGAAEILFANANPELQRCQGLQIINPVWKNGKTFPLLEYFFNEFPAP